MRSSGSRPDESNPRAILLGETPRTSTDGSWRDAFPEIIGRSPAMQKVLETVAKVARSDSSVLILGESGTGKELIASAIHRLSNRAAQRYVPVNTSAIPETLLESEFFGHEKGAFTGAERSRRGHFEMAHGGTIFLDEIGDMPLMLQAKLLRVLQDKRFTPLGGNELREANVRVIAATNRDLDQAVGSGSFRKDLYFRLNVLPIHLPPLRERREDIPDLLNFFVDGSNRLSMETRSPSYLSDELIDFLTGFHWPGNVRQLANLVERMVVMKGGGTIVIDDLPRELVESIDSGFVGGHESSEGASAGEKAWGLASAEWRRMRTSSLTLPRPGLSEAAMPKALAEGHLAVLPEQGLDLVNYIETLENSLIRQALERTGNNRNQAAKLLGLNRTTLVERIKKRKLCPLNEPSKEL